MAITIILAAAVLFILAIILSYILGWASKAFYVETDPRVPLVLNALPGANCGGCGFAGCSDYAEKIVLEGLNVSLCPPGGQACANAIAKIMGVEVGEALPFRPVVHCNAHKEDKHKNALYLGEASCMAMNLISAAQGCVYGCLGLGDCVRICHYDAIHVVNGLATVNYDNCIGCKKCADICPRNIISMSPFKSTCVLSVNCSNREAGAPVRAVCDVGCLGCSICVKTAHDVFHLENGVAVADVNADLGSRMADIQLAMDKCPRHSIVLVGIPSSKDSEMTEDMDTPVVVTPNFKTTVNDMKWRG